VIVLDASVLVHAYFGRDGEADQQRALGFLGGLTGDDELAAPSHFLIEVLGRAAGMINGGLMDAAEVDLRVATVEDFDVTLYPLNYPDTPRLMELGTNLSIPDAGYVVLGERLGVDVVTLDRRMVDAASKAGARCEVREP
jgi:predicted nucleic acid-binding protein